MPRLCAITPNMRSSKPITATKGYAASPADMGAQCRAQVGEIWPNKPSLYGGGDRPVEMLLNACMANGGRIP